MPIGSGIQPPGIPYIGGTYHLYGDSGDNFLNVPYGDSSNYWIDGGDGNDLLLGGDGNDRLEGGAGNDLLYGQAGNDLLSGGDGADGLVGGEGHDVLDGGDGDDIFVVDVTSYNDSYIGGDGSDSMSFYQAQFVWFDLARGSSGDMTWSGIENVEGSNGSDLIWGDGGDNLISGLEGNDTLFGRDGNDHLIGGDGNDHLYGDDGDDVLDGRAGNDVLDGGNGDDVFLYSGQHNFTFIGGEGSDTVSTASLGGSTFLLDTSPYVSSIENLLGGAGQDHFVGSAGDNRLDGAGGNDWLWGMGGSDTLIGGDGADTFVYQDWNDTAADTIVDFTVGEDHIGLSAAGFGLNSLDEIDFIVGSGAQAGDRAALLYDPETGQLSFDLDGAAGVDPVVLATLTGAPELTLQDFLLV